MSARNHIAATAVIVTTTLSSIFTPVPAAAAGPSTSASRAVSRPALQEPAAPGTPFQQALKSTLAERAGANQAVPQSADYSYAVRTEPAAATQARADGAPPAGYLITATTVVHFANPQQAGYDAWPGLIVSGTLPDQAQGTLLPGDYTALAQAAAARQNVSAEQFATGPRTYVFTETYEILPGPAPSLINAAPLAVDNKTSVEDILMGVTYTGPRIRYMIEMDLGWGTYAKAGFALDWGLGLRFPLKVSMRAPDQMAQGSSYAMLANVRGADWSAADYARVGVPTEDGNEFSTRFEFFLGAKAAIAGFTVVDWALDSSWKKQQNFGAYDPFNPTSFGSLAYVLTPEQTGINFSLFGALGLGVGLNLTPSLVPNAIRAQWDASGDATGSGSVEWTASNTDVQAGPIQAANTGPGTDARLRLRQFEYSFKALLLKLAGTLRVDLFGYKASAGEFAIADLDLTGLVGAPTFRTHAGTNDTIQLTVPVIKALQVYKTADRTAVTPGEIVNVTTVISNAGNTALAVTVSDTQCVLGSIGVIPAQGQYTYACPMTVLSDMRNAATAASGSISDTGAIDLYAIDQQVGGGNPDVCTEASLETELAAMPTGATIRFNCGPNPATVTLSHPLSITRDLTLEGVDGLTLSGNSQTRCLDVAAGVSLTLRHLTFAYCVAYRASPTDPPEGGGAIRNRGALTIEASQFRQNGADYGGAIHSSGIGNVTAADTAFLGNRALFDGGAIYNEGNLDLTGGAFADNSANGGGALLNWDGAELTANGVFFSQNRATNGGAVENGGQAVAVISSSRFQNNRAASLGGGFVNMGQGAATISGTTFDGNSAVHGGALGAVETSTLTLDRVTVIDNDAAMYGGGLVTFGSATANLLASSFTGNTASYQGGGLSNRDSAHMNIEGGVIVFNKAKFDGGGLENRAALRIDGTIVESNYAMHGAGMRNWPNATLNIAHSDIRYNNAGGYGAGIHNSGALTIEFGSLTGNRASIDGGALFNDGAAMLTRVEIGSTRYQGNTAAGSGGGLINWMGTLTLDGATVVNNSALFGGGLANGGGGVLTITHSSVTGNQAGWRGGGVVNFADSTLVIVQASSVSSNTVTIDDPARDGSGAGVYSFERGRVLVADSAISYNTIGTAVYMDRPAVSHGGGISNLSGALRLERAELDRNVAAMGSAVENSGGGVLDVVDSTFTSNDISPQPVLHTGALYSSLASTTTVVSSTFTRNSGAIANAGVMWITKTQIIANMGRDQGAGIDNTGVLTLTGSWVLSNTGAIFNAGIWNKGALLVVSTTVAGNQAERAGGGIYNYGTLTLDSSTVSGNYVSGFYSGYGGGLLNYGEATVVNSTISTNRTRSGYLGGGGILNAGHLTLTASTVYSNTPYGIDTVYTGNPAVTTTTVKQIILADNGVDLRGALRSDGYNVIGLLPQEAVFIASAGDRVGDPVTPLDARLGRLADNGGGMLTDLPLPGSPAIDLIPTAACAVAVDQVGTVRPQGPGCDAGAIEVKQQPVPTAGPSVYVLSPSRNDALLDHFDPTVGAVAGNVQFQPSLPNLGLGATLRPGGYIRYAVPGWYGAEPAGTIELWVRPSTYGEVLNLNWTDASHTPPAGHVVHFGMNQTTGQLNFTAWNEKLGTPNIQSKSVIPLNAWTHIAVTWSPNGTKLYLNGKLDNWVLENLYPELVGDNFAFLNTWGADQFAGQVDELHISKVALGADELWYHATGVRDRFNLVDGPLVTRWFGPNGYGGYTIRSGQVLLMGGGPVYWRNGRLGLDQEAYVTFVKVMPDTFLQSLLLKVQGSPPNWANGELALSYEARTKELRVESYLPTTKAWTRYDSVPLVLKSGDVLRARVTPSGVVYGYLNNALVLTQTLNPADQAFFNGKGGRTGLEFISAAGTVLDDFGGGTITSAAAAGQPGTFVEDPQTFVVEEAESPTVKTYLPFVNR